MGILEHSDPSEGGSAGVIWREAIRSAVIVCAQGGLTGRTGVSPVPWTVHARPMQRARRPLSQCAARMAARHAVARERNPPGGWLGGRTGCRDWFREHQWGEGPSGETDVLARAKGLSVNDVVNAGVLFSKGGKTSLVK